MEDTIIVDLYLARDEKAIYSTDEKYGGRLRALSANITGSDEDAGECLNDTYLSAWNSIPPDEPRTYLFAFLARIIRCASLDVCRRRGRQKRTAALTELTRELEECIASPSDADSQADDRELAAVLNDFLGALDAQTRNVFLRRYWYADSIRQIAARFHISESKVKSMLFRTRKKLRIWIEERGFGCERRTVV